MIRTSYRILACVPLLLGALCCARTSPESILREAETALARAEFPRAARGFEAVLASIDADTNRLIHERAEAGALEVRLATASRPDIAPVARILELYRLSHFDSQDICRLAGRMCDAGMFDAARELLEQCETLRPSPPVVDMRAALEERHPPLSPEDALRALRRLRCPMLFPEEADGTR